MTKLRNSARDEECTLRILAVCNYDPATTVLAHIRRPWNAGVGLKPRDDEAVYACSACHDLADRRRPSVLSRAEIDSHLLDGLMKTHRRMREKGLL